MATLGGEKLKIYRVHWAFLNVHGDPPASDSGGTLQYV